VKRNEIKLQQIVKNREKQKNKLEQIVKKREKQQVLKRKKKQKKKAQARWLVLCA